MNAYQTYRQTQAQTAAPGELVLMLYRGAARFVTSAIDAMERKDVVTAHNSLMSAQAIITELKQSLDVERGGDIAQQLERIYEYMHHRLIEANMRKDVGPAREVQRHLRELLPAWEAAVRQTSGTASPALVSALR
jgi:flagellar protein FliS